MYSKQIVIYDESRESHLAATKIRMVSHSNIVNQTNEMR